MKRFLKLLLVFGLTLILVTAVSQWVISNKVRNENQVLLAELASMKSEQENKSQPDKKDGPEISKVEQEELLRLRSEVGQLRIQKEELDGLREENRRLRERVQTQWKLRLSELRTNNIQPGDYLGLVPEMNQALTNDDPSIRIDAARFLRQIGLERILSTNLTAQDLSDLKSAAMAAAPSLLAALKDPDPLVHANISITLGFLHEDSQNVVPALIEDLSDGQWRVAGAAAKSLGRFQGDAISAVPALLQAAQSSDPAVRESAVGALKEIDPIAARNAGF